MRRASDILLERANGHQNFQYLPRGPRDAVMRFYINLRFKAMHRVHVAWFHKQKIKQKYVKIRLETPISIG